MLLTKEIFQLLALFHLYYATLLLGGNAAMFLRERLLSEKAASRECAAMPKGEQQLSLHMC